MASSLPETVIDWGVDAMDAMDRAGLPDVEFNIELAKMRGLHACFYTKPGRLDEVRCRRTSVRLPHKLARFNGIAKRRMRERLKILCR